MISGSEPPPSAAGEPPSALPIRVLVVDDHPILLEGLRAILHRSNIEVVGTAGNGGAAIAAALALTPDVVLMDLMMPDMDGIEATRRIKAALPATSVLILSALSDTAALRAALLAGASGYLLKGISAVAIRDAVTIIREGGNVIDPDLLRALIQPAPEMLPEPDPSLRSRLRSS